MRLYSTSEIVHIMEQALRDKGFSIESRKRTEIEAKQWAGFVSQTFKIKIESGD
jgi:hypothetical protein